MTIVVSVVLIAVIVATTAKRFWEQKKQNQMITVLPLQQQHEPAAAPATFHLNNQAYNKAIATTGQYLIMMILFFVGISGQLVIPLPKVIENPWLTFPRHMLFPAVSGFFVPSIFYVWNKSARKHVKGLIQEMVS